MHSLSTSEPAVTADLERAVHRLFVEHGAVIHRYVARRVGTDLADDVVAETFRRAFESIGSRYPDFEDRMSLAGYPGYGDDSDDADNNPFAAFRADPEPSDAELAMANADADCSVATDEPTAYVEAVVPVVDAVEREHADGLAELRAERDAALALARQALTAHGIEPLTS